MTAPEVLAEPANQNVDTEGVIMTASGELATLAFNVERSPRLDACLPRCYTRSH